MFTPIRPKDISNKRYEPTGLKKSETGVSSAERSENSFSETLSNTLDTNPQIIPYTDTKVVPWEEISGLIGELENQGEALSRIPSLENFYQFRLLLQKILKKAVPQAMVIEKDYSLNTSNLTQKEFHLVKNINKELSSLLKMIENNQKDNFIIANKVISIKGLLVDFYS